MQQFSRLVLLCSTFLLTFLPNNQVKASLELITDNILKAERLPPCQACKAFIESFKKGIEKTKRGKFEGGDSAWEEDKQKSYANSEVRLTEIEESLCKDLKKGQEQCLELAVELESAIEDWWFKKRDNYPDIYDYICIQTAEKCCPKDHYGPECKQCTGYPNNVCSNNGKCKGSGTRKGNGQCVCDKGYTGGTCSDCVTGHYEAYRDENKVLCSICHESCAQGCVGAGALNCQGNCKKGWQKIGEQGCIDINECLESEKHCPDNQFCVNKEGNYSCLSCDRACDGCTGDGPDMCINCAEDYVKEDNICINPDILGRKRHENMARYATYFGLCLATCIILQRNFYVASGIGLFVGLYISVSEYMIANSDIQNATPNLNILSPID